MPTIRVSKELQNVLQKRKTSRDDTYEGVIWDLLENDMELSEETKKHILQA